MSANNLSIENLSRIVETGDVEGMLGGARTAVVSEARAASVAKENGIDPAGAGKGVTFSELMEKSLAQVNQDQYQADKAVKELVAGRSKNIHETMLAIERADTSLKLMMQVRNKVLDAYREIMRMQV